MANLAKAELKDAQEWQVDDLKAVLADALKAATRAGASAADASVSADAGLSVTSRMGEVETVEFHRDHGLGITVYFGQRKGSASTSDLKPKAIADAVNAAVNIARFTAEDEYSGLADAALMAREFPDLDLDHPWALSPDDAISLTIACEDHARNSDARIVNSEGASVSTVRGAVAYGNTHGFIGAYRSGRHSLSCTVVASENGAMQRDYWYTNARRAEDMDTAESVGKRSAERALRRLGARSLDTGKFPVLLEADIARSLIGSFLSAIRGGALYRKSTFLLDHLGKAIFPEFVRIHEQPHIPRALGSASFDNEGVATTPKEFVSGGVLQSYVLDSYSARRLGMQTTGNSGGVRNLMVESGSKDFAALLKEMDKGLLVTEFIGSGINMVTGDYSRGAAGFWVENGEIQYPVEEITVAGNLKDMFKGIVAIGSDIDTRGNIRCGSILLDAMTVAGK